MLTPLAPRSLIANLCISATALLLLCAACSRQTAEPLPEPEVPTESPESRHPASEKNPELLAEAIDPRAELTPGQTFEGELGPGESHLYSIDASAGYYLHVVADQQDVDVVVSLLGAGDEVLLRMDRPISDHGPEHIFAVIQEAGVHYLRVVAQSGLRPTGKYAVRLAEYRLASMTDRARAEAASTYSEGRGLFRKGDYRLAAERFQEGLAAWEDLRDLSWQGESLILLGRSHAMMGEWQSAITYHKRAVVLLEKAGNARLQAMALHQIGLIYLHLRDLAPAIRSFREALPLRQEAHARRGEALTYHALGQAFLVQDEVQQSLDYYAQALALFNRPRDRAPSIHDRGVLFLSLGRMEQARDALLEAEELTAALADHRRRAAALNQLGELHRRKGELEAALNYFDQALILRRTLGDRRGEVNSLAKIGRVHQAHGDYAYALTFYQNALEILDEFQEPWLAAKVLLNLGSLHLDQGQPTQALDVFRRSLVLFRQVGDPTGEAEGLLGFARSERQQGRLTAAREVSEQALRIIESVRPRAVSYDLRSSFFATIQQHFEFHIDLLMELHSLERDRGYDALGLKISEQARARSLLDLLIEAGAEIRRGADPELLERERAVQGQLNAWEKRRFQLHNDARHEQKVKDAEKTIRRLLEELTEVQTKIRLRHPRYADLKHGQVLNAASIQREVLDEDTLLLEYWLGEKRSFLWAVTVDSIESFELPGRAAIESSARHAYRLLTKSNRREAQAGTRDALCALSRQLLEPAARLLAGKRLLIVADGALQFIPFAALPEPGDADRCTAAKPLVVAHEITYLPSASTLPVLRRGLERSPSAVRSVAVVADPVFVATDRRVRSSPSGPDDAEPVPVRSATRIDLSSFRRLPFSRREADVILDLVGPDVGFRAVDFGANKEIVTSGRLADYRFVHFATHGILDTTNPELSGIVLSLVDQQGRQRDGFLRTHEIYNLDLTCELVVLSACQTALGKEVHGEGLIGLTRGFMYAGAARAMVSLWNVSDEGTAELMELFYRGLLERNQRPTEALREAQISMLEKDARAASYYWAGFVIQGDWR